MNSAPDPFADSMPHVLNQDEQGRWTVSVNPDTFEAIQDGIATKFAKKGTDGELTGEDGEVTLQQYSDFVDQLEVDGLSGARLQTYEKAAIWEGLQDSGTVGLDARDATKGTFTVAGRPKKSPAGAAHPGYGSTLHASRTARFGHERGDEIISSVNHHRRIAKNAAGFIVRGLGLAPGRNEPSPEEQAAEQAARRKEKWDQGRKTAIEFKRFNTDEDAAAAWEKATKPKRADKPGRGRTGDDRESNPRDRRGRSERADEARQSAESSNIDPDFAYLLDDDAIRDLDAEISQAIRDAKDNEKDRRGLGAADQLPKDVFTALANNTAEQVLRSFVDSNTPEDIVQAMRDKYSALLRSRYGGRGKRR